MTQDVEMKVDVEMKEVTATPSNPISSPDHSLLQSKKQQNPNKPLVPLILFSFLSLSSFFCWILRYMNLILIGVKWGGLRFEGDCVSHWDGDVLEGGTPHCPSGPPHHRFEAEAEGISALLLPWFRPCGGFGGAFEAIVLYSQGKCCELLLLMYQYEHDSWSYTGFCGREFYANMSCALLAYRGF